MKLDPTAVPPDGAPAPSGRRWRILWIAIPVALLLAAAAIVFAVSASPPDGVSAPGQTPDQTSGQTPSAQPSETPDPDEPVAPPVEPAVPDTEPVDIDEPAAITPGLTAEITTVEAVNGIARGPGEVAGPSLRVTVTIANNTLREAPLTATVVSAYFGADRTPAPELREPGGSALPAAVGPGAKATGVYIFSVPEAERDNVTLLVDYSVDVDPLVFQGDIETLMNR